MIISIGSSHITGQNIMMNSKVTIREMRKKDCPAISNAFAAQGWDKPVSQYLHYWQESTENKRVILVAECEGEFAGYLTIVWESDYPPFREAMIPEVVDFNVLLKFRKQKIGTALMDEAERRIALKSPWAGIGVCLHVDYGAAQVLYVKRGYVPDGRGIFYQGHYAQYGEQVTIDDNLTLYLVKPTGQVSQGFSVVGNCTLL
jgi:GNAT superfamily N-acetyltransferase